MDIILLGPPGVGKGTQATRLAQAYQLFHLSTGDILRQTIAQGSELGKRIQQTVETGQLVDDATAFEAIQHTARAQQSAFKGLLFDGFPRTLDQAKLLEDSRLTDKPWVLVLEANEEAIKARLTGRF